jgi:hypothetical protein
VLVLAAARGTGKNAVVQAGALTKAVEGANPKARALNRSRLQEVKERVPLSRLAPVLGPTGRHRRALEVRQDAQCVHPQAERSSTLRLYQINSC